MARGIIGLDIGSHSIKLVELKEAKGGSWKLVKFGLHKLPAEAIVDGAIMNSAAVVEGIRDLIARHKIKTREVATCVSGHSVIIKKITLPTMSEDELNESIQWEAEQYIPFSINDVNLDTQILSQGEEASNMDVLLVAAKKDIIHEYTAAIAEAGLKPLIVDVACFSIENCFDLNEDPAPGEISALVNVGASLVNINILNNGVTAFTRDINMGGNQFTEEIQKQLNISYEEAEALKLGGNISSSQSTTEAVVPQEVGAILRSTSETLAVEIQRSIDFYLATSPGLSLGRLVLSGGTAKIAGLKDALESSLNTKVELADPFKNISYSPKDFDPDYLKDLAPMSAVAVGLASRRLGDKPA
ncbi:MAG: type IV pilus assembly protein PilM [Deltaproteobacteria bacterium]|nr:type IV pilus assembly protein PilM [Deltaproteobacteria bacterium]